MITPKRIQELAEPVEGIYINIVNELMVNIGKHITSPTWTHTASWEIQKLSEMGQLTKENAAIINKWIKQIPPEMRSTMEATRAVALDRIEAQMEKAAEDGYLTPPLADSTVQVMQDLSAQAADKLNLVNTTMLQSSLQQYAKAVNLTENIYQRSQNTQEALNDSAAAVASGVLTRKQAVRHAIRQISQEGLTGFYDKSGRSWSPEAYVNMVVRTTVHNTSIQAVKSRMEDYGTDVFQISSHAGARPRCYPYQGWFCSWGNRSGKIELGDGRVVDYRPLSDTSYGEPAGIFGINCGHYPIPIIPGLTIPHGEDNIQDKEANDKAYAESQEQRALERKIREAKRTIEMGDDSDEAKQKLKDAQARMRTFIQDTGRTRRYDRENLYGTPTIEAKRDYFDRKFNAKYKAKTTTDLLQNNEQALTIDEKLTGYSLNKEHPEGKHKAVVFESALGYNLSNSEMLAAEIRKGIAYYKAIPKGSTEYGDKYDVLMLVNGANGNKQPVVTGWIFRTGDDFPRMVTAYVSDKIRRP